ncbi:MAG TPA: response regulator transcription factor [Candidatus Acidoferrales bacterium]|nr:response regulator transcription factor [Candidatus Acidoferrales bacterium]
MPSIIIADDNEHMRRTIGNELRRIGEWKVCAEAANGDEAVKLTEKLEPDVVVLDFQMPVMNGLDAAREIIKHHPELPIVMYTLHNNPFLESQAKAIGVRKFISKTEMFSTLIPSLEEILS